MSYELPHSDDAVRKATHKTWDEWKTIIDAWGGANKPHPEIATFLTDDQGLDGWWAQGVTVGYERMIGRRAVGQSNDGSYSASVSKTINASAEMVHAALADDEQRSQWLEGGLVSLRTASAPKSVRFDDHEAGVIIAAFLSVKGKEKTSLQLQVEKLPSKEAGDVWKAAWKTRLAMLAGFLNH